MRCVELIDPMKNPQDLNHKVIDHDENLEGDSL